MKDEALHERVSSDVLVRTCILANLTESCYKVHKLASLLDAYLRHPRPSICDVTCVDWGQQVPECISPYRKYGLQSMHLQVCTPEVPKPLPNGYREWDCVGSLS